MRRRQLDILASALETLSAAGAIIVAVDFNSAFNRPGDRETILEFRRPLNLQDSGAGPEIPFWRERDYILYRNGGATTLAVKRMGEATEFVNEDVALSDHPALYARFRIRAERGSGAEGP
jgi:endonuclease/exonuclease/phosphatase (EEP) superfamily protein YafD